MIAMTSPASTSRSMPFKTSLSPKRFLTSVTVMSDIELPFFHRAASDGLRKNVPEDQSLIAADATAKAAGMRGAQRRWPCPHTINMPINVSE
jgi:hypothetical protein